MTVGVVFQCTGIASKPVLTLSEAILNVNLLRVSGSIRNAAGACSLYVVIDGDLSQLFLVGSGVDAWFAVNCELPVLVEISGQLLFSAVDETNGLISDGIMIHADPIQTQTARRTGRTRTSSRRTRISAKSETMSPTGVALVTIGTFILVGVAGGVVVVLFRRHRALSHATESGEIPNVRKEKDLEVESGIPVAERGDEDEAVPENI
jgi:hypothetical protein